MALITTAYYETLYGQVGDEAKLSAHIDGVSDEIVDYVALFDDEDEPINADEWGTASGDTEPPGSIQYVCARVVNRALANPFGVTQEGLGDHNVTYATGASGGTLGPKDKRIIRRAIGRLGVNTVALEGFLPIEPESLVEFP